MKTSRLRLLTVVSLVTASVAGGGAAARSFSTIDSAQGGFLGALSRDGRIAAGAYVSFGMYAGSWSWRAGVGAVDLPMNVAVGMDSWGQPIVGSADDGRGIQVAALAYSDVATTGPVLIGGYPGSVPMDNFLSQAYGISDTGVAVGLAYDATNNPIAFRWTSAEGMSRLPVERPGTFSRANGISRNGNVIYGWNDRSDGYRAGVIWVDGSPLALHNDGPFGDAFGSPPGEALASNDDGSVVVGLNFWNDQMQSEAWRWTRATGVEPIGVITPPERGRPVVAPERYAPAAGYLRRADWPGPHGGWGNDPESVAIAVSADGNTVVGHSGPPFNTDAFIWTPATGMVLLADYAAARGVVIPDGFLLYAAAAISADGLTIGGTGIDPSGTFTVPWIIDLHDGAQRAVDVVAVGTVSANDLASGPFAGVPSGASVTLRFSVLNDGNSVTPGHVADYAVDAASFGLEATWIDPAGGPRLHADEALAAGANPLLHLANDQPRADSLSLDGALLATSGQSLQFQVANSDGRLYDSDQILRINRSLASDLFDTAQWSIGDAGHAMKVTVQWVAIKDSGDGIFSNGFDGG